MTGVRPMHIPMLMKVWNRKMDATPRQTRQLMEFFDRSPTFTQRMMIASSSAMTTQQPIMPSSSPMTAKMKSVCCSGTA